MQINVAVAVNSVKTRGSIILEFRTLLHLGREVSDITDTWMVLFRPININENISQHWSQSTLIYQLLATAWLRIQELGEKIGEVL